MEESARSPMSFATTPMSPNPTKLRSVSESPYESPHATQDDWGEASPDRLSATQGSSSKWRTQSKLGQSCSAPLLHRAQGSPQSSTWYASNSRSTTLHGAPMWQALGTTWRSRDKDDFGASVRKNADEANAFADGCMPNWNQMHIRKNRILEHELTWAYYRMKRHGLHPMRKDVGDPHMPPECLAEKMRYGSENKFQFWRDCRPPFIVRSVRRIANGPESGHHPDGDLFKVTYQCGIDYCGERLWNLKSEAGTFDNLIQGVARIRIPDEFPKIRKFTIESWGQPSLNSTHWEKPEFDEETVAGPTMVDPNVWMPISQELDTSPGLARFAGCREATRKAVSNRPVKMPPLQKLLLGPDKSVGKFAAASPPRIAPDPADAGGMTPSPQKKKHREHRIFTAAAGFVRYHG